jgi:VanZ family protein
MLTPRTLQRCFKAFFAIAFASLMVVMLGPFQDLELRFGFTDKEAHAIAFFAVTNALFIIAPRRRRTDLAVVAAALGLAIELLQGLTGRDMSLADFIADAAGIAAAVLPGMVERLRHQLRIHPDLSVRQLRAMDRRKRRRRRPAPQGQGQGAASSATPA